MNSGTERPKGAAGWRADEEEPEVGSCCTFGFMLGEFRFLGTSVGDAWWWCCGLSAG